LVHVEHGGFHRLRHREPSYTGTVRRWTSVFASLVVAALATAAAGVPARTPVITVSSNTPRVGDRVAVVVAGSATCTRVVAVSPTSSQYPIRLSRRASMCRGMFRFPTAGRWTLRFGRISKVVRVLVALPTPDPAGAPLGRPGCEPPSPVTPGRTGLPEAFGTTSNGQLWALFFHGAVASNTAAVFTNLVGRELKVVLKRTAGVDLTTATAPDGTERQPVWQRTHSGSTWARPGAEWGTGWQITEPGCWRIHVGSIDMGADLWFRVVS
jgi:hypothetical protein